MEFSKSDFDFFYHCPKEKLDGEISRLNIRLKLQDKPQTEQEQKSYQECIDQIAILKSISQLRQGKLDPEEFAQKVKIA